MFENQMQGGEGLKRISKVMIYISLTQVLSATVSGQTCDSYTCDSIVVDNIISKNDYAVKVEKITYRSDKRIDSLTLGVDPQKSIKVRTVVGFHRIVDLSELKYLNLRIFWADTIPSDLNKLVNLEVLEIASFQIKELPIKIFQMSSLKKLNLEGSKIEILHDDIRNLANLEYLSLYANNLVALPSAIGELGNLRFLNLADNEISNFPNSILGLAKLDSLHCWYNRLCDLDPKIEEWVNSVEVYTGWKDSQDCSTKINRSNMNYVKAKYQFPKRAFNVLGKASTYSSQIFHYETEKSRDWGKWQNKEDRSENRK